MAINVQIQDERGARLGDEFIWEWHFSTEALLKSTELSYACLRFVEPYADVTFNQLQIPVLLDEVQRVRKLSVDADHQQALDELYRFVDQARGRDLIYVKFIGD